MIIRTNDGFEFSKDGIKEGTICVYCGANHVLETKGDEQRSMCKFCRLGCLTKVGFVYTDGTNTYKFNGDSFFVDHSS